MFLNCFSVFFLYDEFHKLLKYFNDKKITYLSLLFSKLQPQLIESWKKVNFTNQELKLEKKVIAFIYFTN